MADEATVLDALGDPTRRTVLELLRGGERSVRELTDATTASQPAGLRAWVDGFWDDALTAFVAHTAGGDEA